MIWCEQLASFAGAFFSSFVKRYSFSALVLYLSVCCATLSLVFLVCVSDSVFVEAELVSFPSLLDVFLCCYFCYLCSIAGCYFSLLRLVSQSRQIRVLFPFSLIVRIVRVTLCELLEDRSPPFVLFIY